MQNHNFRQMILSEKWFIYFFYDIMFMVCHYSLTLSESYKHDIINSSISHVCVWLAHISEWCDGVNEVNSHKIWIRSSQARLVCSFYSYNSSTLMHLIRFCIWVEILPNSVEYIYILRALWSDSRFEISMFKMHSNYSTFWIAIECGFQARVFFFICWHRNWFYRCY